MNRRTNVRTRLTFFFSALFCLLLAVALAFLYYRVTRSLHKDFRHEMIHDGRLIAEIFKEELKLNELNEFKEEIREFEMDLLVLDKSRKVVVESDGWRQKGIILDSAWLTGLKEQPAFKELAIEGRPYALFSRSVHLPTHGSFTLHILRSRQSRDKISETLLFWMLIIAPFMVLLSAGAGVLITARTLEAEERAFDRLRRFTADASHELRIPITALRGALEVALRKERPPKEYQETMRDALEEAERLSELTQDLLLLAQGDEGSLSLNKQDVALEPFLQDVFSKSQVLPNQNHVKIHLSPVPEGTGRFDPERVSRLLLNLIDNAIKYNRPGGSVTLGAEFDNPWVKFTIKDTGIGVSKPEIGKIFERFYRVDKARSREIGGTGLGLSIAQWIANAHQGRIEVDSQEGKGTTFIVTLPRSLN